MKNLAKGNEAYDDSLDIAGDESKPNLLPLHRKAFSGPKSQLVDIGHTSLAETAN